MRKRIREWIEAIRPRAVLVVKTEKRIFYASFEDNDSAKAFQEKQSPGKLVLDMRDKGEDAFAGCLPWSLPRSDREITANPGDILLIGENALAICYEKQTGTMTRLARIGNVTKEQLKEALGAGPTPVSMYLEWSE